MKVGDLVKATESATLSGDMGLVMGFNIFKYPIIHWFKFGLDESIHCDYVEILNESR